MSAKELFAASEATWPPASRRQIAGFLVRDGQGGGSRVSSATAEPGWAEADIADAEAAMTETGQSSLFMIRPGDEALDAALAARGYAVADRVVIYTASVASLEPPPDPMKAFPHWPPLAVADAIWADEGIGPPRRAVMDRVQGPHAAVLGRTADHAAGVGFTAISGQFAALHALVVRKEARRTGTGGNILRRAAAWAGQQGAKTLMLAVTETNVPARALYASLGMQAVEQYHYRAK